MKSTIIFLLVIFFLGQEGIKGQEGTSYRKNYISFNILPFYGVGMAYERLLNTGRFVRGSVRGRLISSLSPSIGGSILLGKTHNLELGADYLISYKADGLSNPDNKMRFSRLEPFFGYRFQHKKGFTARVFCPFRYEDFFGIPNIGLSIGYSW
ncbi:hypothetical protein [Zobellia galactanivorans]|uniref:hypothetical protein n=1 Tax=Zobellia galactanivorans (strain DSM 12802 / CCUG 47099 / CIP 106680 / NCIMB 13871 / Dsij) TaxID=63186 RepID=UPI001C06F39F|nr:hypothetical protein [Zobellia galactanivorans]MBU3026044.1 hypothetical protein [Zobellia galactanivorans]